MFTHDIRKLKIVLFLVTLDEGYHPFIMYRVNVKINSWNLQRDGATATAWRHTVSSGAEWQISAIYIDFAEFKF